MDRVTIVGAGLAGTLCALYLARRGYEVDIYESRPDLRKGAKDYGRSINLALSCRGLTGLKVMDLLEDVQKIMVPMRARAIHESSGELVIQPFGRHEKEYINAISRADLNGLLLDKAESTNKIHINFSMKLLNLDVHSQQLIFETKNNDRFGVKYERLIGADGAPSKVRDCLVENKIIKATREYLDHGYKELSISKHHTKGMVREHLHLWPRDSFMLLGNPNPDDSITGSLFLANEGEDSFEQITDESKLTSFFKREFPDAFHAMPHLVDEFFSNPTGLMSTIKCNPWFYKDQCLLIGDAAHGIIPFFGQGMNSAFEDCRILDELLTHYKDEWAQVMPAFFNARKVNTDAIAQMSMDNYHEIHADIRHSQFILMKQVERELMRRYPERYVSQHILVMFTNTPYAHALAHKEIQDQLLGQICNSITAIKEVDWKIVDKLMQDYDRKLAILK